MSSSLEDQNKDSTNLESTNISYFGNQVSGHSCLLKGTSNSYYIYKPFNLNEAEFYENITKNKELALSSFVAGYHGIMNLPKPIIDEFASKINQIESLVPENQEKIIPSTNELNSNSPEKHQKGSPVTILRTKKEWFKQLFLKRFDNNTTSFLKLEDLTLNMASPCMMDIKMGSVAYNPHKMEHQLSKLNNTTSSSLKFRICGMQVKNPKLNEEYFRDKYWGRELKPDKIKNALALFFYNGQGIRRNLVRHYIKRLNGLADAVKAAVGYKFYSVSLLLTYDSLVDDENYDSSENPESYYDTKIRLNLIDFAKSKYDENLQETDGDLLIGIENLLKCFKYIQDNPEIGPHFSFV